MTRAPFTLAQASLIAQQFQFLVGSAYDKQTPGTTPILAVLVAPASEAEQNYFMDEYERTGNTALGLYNDAQGYDVVVIARYIADPELYQWMDVFSFMVRNNPIPSAPTAASIQPQLHPIAHELAA